MELTELPNSPHFSLLEELAENHQTPQTQQNELEQGDLLQNYILYKRDGTYAYCCSTAYANLGLVGSGRIIRDEHGKLVIAFYMHLGKAYHAYAEPNALLIGLILCYQLGLSNVFVESDYYMVVNRQRNIS